MNLLPWRRWQRSPPRVDARQLDRYAPASLDKYRAEALRFSNWLVHLRIAPMGADDWDDLAVEYLSSVQLSYDDFGYLLAALELVFPRYKGRLKWARSIHKSWAIHKVVKHTTPLCRGPANLFACWMAVQGRVRLGVGLLLQQRRGMRPSEMLNLRAEDFLLPEEHGLCSRTGYAEIVLGAKAGTKSKRPQVVIVRGTLEPELLVLLRRAKRATPTSQRLVPYSIDAYRSWLKKIAGQLHLTDLDFSPHSPRAGFASEGRARGVPFSELQEEGRWAAAASLRVYIDLAQAASIGTRLKTAGLGPAIQWVTDHLLDYFPQAALDAAYPRA